MMEPPNYTIFSKGSITSKACRRKCTNTLHPFQRCQIMNLQKPHYINFTPWYCPNTARSHINWLHRTLQYYITRQLICLYCGMQLYRLPFDNPNTRQKERNSSHTLVFRNNAQIQLLHSNKRTEFSSKVIEHLAQQLSIKKNYISPHQPQANGKLESSYRFIKDCIWKFSIDGTLEWDSITPLCNCYIQLVP